MPSTDFKKLLCGESVRVMYNQLWLVFFSSCWNLSFVYFLLCWDSKIFGLHAFAELYHFHWLCEECLSTRAFWGNATFPLFALGSHLSWPCQIHLIAEVVWFQTLLHLSFTFLTLHRHKLFSYDHFGGLHQSHFFLHFVRKKPSHQKLICEKSANHSV